VSKDFFEITYNFTIYSRISYEMSLKFRTKPLERCRNRNILL
jgi:hypothetical protein